MLEQHGSDSAPLMLVDHRKGDFGARWIGAAHIAGVSDESFFPRMPYRRDQTDVIDKIQLRELCQLSLIQRTFHAKEAVVSRIFTEFLEMLQQPFTIIWLNRAHMNRP